MTFYGFLTLVNNRVNSNLMIIS